MTTLQALSTDELVAELKRRETAYLLLSKRRAKLLGDIDQVDLEMAHLSCAPAKRQRSGSAKAGKTTPRPKNAMSLQDALAAAVAVGETVSPKAAVQAVLKAGYQTTAKSFAVQVAGRLAKDERFERAERGLYKRTK